MHGDVRFATPAWDESELNSVSFALGSPGRTRNVSPAFVDGKAVPLLRANYAFQALEVPAGKSQVQLVYQDNAFRLGAWLSVGGLLVCALLFRRSRHTSTPAAESGLVAP